MTVPSVCKDKTASPFSDSIQIGSSDAKGSFFTVKPNDRS